ncbi:hypothetical protein V6N12_075824 [Hibiscus sabdariffa]|uniref:Uncharacterized protein n=1 Tax=Hibiscus sabdariffa TaxID=183260 RepID=A0ABR1ZIY7_9ROSI
MEVVLKLKLIEHFVHVSIHKTRRQRKRIPELKYKPSSLHVRPPPSVTACKGHQQLILFHSVRQVTVLPLSTPKSRRKHKQDQVELLQQAVPLPAE